MDASYLRKRRQNRPKRWFFRLTIIMAILGSLFLGIFFDPGWLAIGIVILIVCLAFNRIKAINTRLMRRSG